MLLITSATSLPDMVAPFRSFPTRYSRVSLDETQDGPESLLPWCFVLCPLRPPSLIAEQGLNRRVELTWIVVYAIPHNCQTRSRSAAMTRSSDFP